MGRTMHALVVDGGALTRAVWPRPELDGPSSVRVRIATAGICRTDLYVARGRIPHRVPVVLGHEAAGVVAEIGAGVARVRAGDRVAIDPRVGDGRVLGIHEHGVFADEVVVPESCVHRVPSGVRAELAAMVEPIAASTAVLGLGLDRAAHGTVIGEGRIAAMTRRVLAHAGYALERVLESDAGGVDFAVVTSANGGGLSRAMRVCRAGGVVVLKSREPEPVALDVALAVRKRLTLHAVDYGDFAGAVELAADGIELDDLIGPAYELTDAERAFAHAEADESVKRFFRISDVWAG